MKSRLWFALALALVVCSAVYAVKRVQRAGDESFTLHFRVADYTASGEMRDLGTRVRYVSADSNWRETGQTSQGSAAELISDGERGGVFSVQPEKEVATRVAASARPKWFSAEEWRKNPQFAREDVLLGRVAFVMEVRDADGRLLGEEWKIPEFGPHSAKQVLYMDDGGRRVTEAVAVTPGEPAAGTTRLPSKYKVVDAPLPKHPKQTANSSLNN